MPRPDDGSRWKGPMTPEEVKAMHVGTFPVEHNNGSNWLAWIRKGTYYVKHISGPMPKAQETERAGHYRGTPRKMNEEEFLRSFQCQ